jgi:hypothetical protein
MENPDPGSGIQDGSNPDPGSSMKKIQVLDPGDKHPGSATLPRRTCTYFTLIPDGFLVVRCVCAGMRESLTEVISKSLSKLATQSEGGETVIDETLLS